MEFIPNSNMIVVDLLVNGGQSQIIAIPSRHRFNSIAAREAYFAANSSELQVQMWCMVQDKLYLYISDEWREFTTAVTGPAGAPFVFKDQLHDETMLPDPLYAATNEGYLVEGKISASMEEDPETGEITIEHGYNKYEDGLHLFILVDEKWADQGAFMGVPGPRGEPGPQGPPGPKGDKGDCATFRIEDNGHLIAIYPEDGEIHGN